MNHKQNLQEHVVLYIVLRHMTGIAKLAYLCLFIASVVRFQLVCTFVPEDSRVVIVPHHNFNLYSLNSASKQDFYLIFKCIRMCYIFDFLIKENHCRYLFLELRNYICFVDVLWPNNFLHKQFICTFQEFFSFLRISTNKPLILTQ